MHQLVYCVFENKRAPADKLARIQLDSTTVPGIKVVGAWVET